MAIIFIKMGLICLKFGTNSRNRPIVRNMYDNFDEVTNVFNDLQVQRTKKPRLLMVTGVSQFIGSNRPGNCLVYIVDATTGNFAAYAVPWNRQLESTGRPQSGALVALKVGQARNITLGQ